jgi:predicted RNA-binding protein with PUA-like domain
MVDLRAVEKLARPVTLVQIKATKALANMQLVKLGRLSVQAVTEKEYETILKMGGERG